MKSETHFKIKMIFVSLPPHVLRSASAGGVELFDAVMDYEHSLINDQVENGIATRMAVLYYLKPE